MITPERLQEIVTVGVHDITPTEILEIAEELLTLREERHKKDIEGRTYIEINEYIKLEQQNKELIEDAERLFVWAGWEFGDLSEANANKFIRDLSMHTTLMEKYNVLPS